MLDLRRRQFITLLGGMAAAWPLAARAQSPKMLRVGYSGMLPREAPHYAAFEKRMAELGYQEGRNFTFEYIQTPSIAGYELTYRELAARNVDILLAAGNEPALRAARAAAGTTPTVFIALDFDPVEKGYVASLSRPGNNSTGLFVSQLELAGKRVEFLRKTFPKARRIGLLWDATSREQADAAAAVAGQLAFEPPELPIQTDRTQAMSARDVIVGDVVNFELTSVHVAQHEIGGAWCMDRRDASKPPIEPDRAEKEGIRNLIIGDVVELQIPGVEVAHDHVGRAVAVEIAEAGRPPLPPDRAHRSGAGELIICDVIDLQLAGEAVAHDHVARAVAVEIAETLHRPGQAHPSHEVRAGRFNFARHRWLGLVARDDELPGAAFRTAVLLWELQNVEHGYAWPSLTYIATELKMHKSTVIRSLRILRARGWITIARRGGRHRTNQYRIGFGRMEDDDAASLSQPGNETVAPEQRNGRSPAPQQ
jgi:hypothetical protein